nr:MAG TPA: hypothetical protein [Caudoviricetes sp.]
MRQRWKRDSRMMKGERPMPRQWEMPSGLR